MIVLDDEARFPVREAKWFTQKREGEKDDHILSTTMYELYTKRNLCG
jgi:hypothetical protein